MEWDGKFVHGVCICACVSTRSASLLFECHLMRRFGSFSPVLNFHDLPLLGCFNAELYKKERDLDGFMCTSLNVLLDFELSTNGMISCYVFMTGTMLNKCCEETFRVLP